MKKITVIMQGPVYDNWTASFYQRYQEMSFVERVILSTWKGEKFVKGDVIYNSKPDYSGIHNRNYQIVSSYNGILKSETEICLKVRSDMFLPNLEQMLRFFLDNDQNQIYTLSIYPRFVFHPRDHVFLGTTENLKTMFNIPLDYEKCSQLNPSSNYVRTETYIGVWWYAKQEPKIENYIAEPINYLMDNSPKRNEALEVYHKLIRENKGFLPFPRIPIEWPKHYPEGYPFEKLKIYGEIYHGENL